MFSDKHGDVPKLDEEEDEEESGEKDREKDSDGITTNIKSKKAFSMAINDKAMPPAIRRVSRTAQIIIAFLISLAIAEYVIVFR